MPRNHSDSDSDSQDNRGGDKRARGDSRASGQQRKDSKRDGKKVVSDSESDRSQSPKRNNPESDRSNSSEPVAKRSRSNSRAQAADDGPLELFVKGLDYNTDENGLRGHFEQFGELTKCKLIMKQGRSAGIAFIEYTNPQDAAKA